MTDGPHPSKPHPPRDAAGPPRGCHICRIYAVISPDSPRYPGWLAELGRDHAPLLSAEAVLLDCPEGGPDRPHYLVDFRALREEIRLAICSSAAARHGVSEAEVREEFDELGMPVLADDVAVCTDPDRARASLPFWSRSAQGLAGRG